jgi:hypothetical protein
MRSKFITDPQDPFGDGVPGPVGEWVSPNFFPATFAPAAGHEDGNSSAGTSLVSLLAPVPIVPAEAVEAQAAQTGSGGPGSVVAVTSQSGGFTINLIFDAAAMASTTAAANFRAGIEQAASMLSATITNKNRRWRRRWTG